MQSPCGTRAGSGAIAAEVDLRARARARIRWRASVVGHLRVDRAKYATGARDSWGRLDPRVGFMMPEQALGQGGGG